MAGSGSQSFGDADNDTIIAGNGLTVMQGDPLTAPSGLGGSAGNDVFSFARTASAPIGGAYLVGTAGIYTGPQAGYFDEIKDFARGFDKIHLAQSGASTAVNVVNIILHAAGTSFTTESSAQAYAQGLLDA